MFDKIEQIEQNSELRSLDIEDKHINDGINEENLRRVKINEEQLPKMINNNDKSNEIINILPSWSIEPPLEIRR